MSLLKTARELFLGTLQQLDISEVIRQRVCCVDGALHVGELVYPLAKFRRIVVVAIGKAATPMYDALLPVFLPALRADQAVEAVVVGTEAPQSRDILARYFRGSHPMPDQTSRDAAETILALLRSCDDMCLVLFLISGGSSAMVERALDPCISLEEEVAFYKALVQSGLPIEQMNLLRKHFSKVKGGRLALAARGATQCSLLISDVPHGMEHVIGSGPSLPDPSTAEDCRALIKNSRGNLVLSDELSKFFHDSRLPETPKGDDPSFSKAAWISLLSSDDLCDNASRLATAKGFRVVVDNHCDEWDYRDAAKYLTGRLEELRTSSLRVCLISAGEVSVQISGKHGMGGRNQQFALECARLFHEQKIMATVVSGGSDGVDGNSPSAGAVCDETTFDRAASCNIDLYAALRDFDGYTALHALGADIFTGPTGNNVRDLRILLSKD